MKATYNFLAVVVACLAVLLAVDKASAACEPAFVDFEPPSLPDHNPFNGEETLQDARVHLINTGDSACGLVLTFDPGAGPRILEGPGKGLRYELRDENQRKLAGRNAIGQGIPVHLPADMRKPKSVAYWVAVSNHNPNQVARPGLYAADVELNLFKPPPGRPELIDSRTVPLRVTVPSIAQVSFAGTRGRDKWPGITSQLLDFGELSRGVTKSARFLVRTNSDQFEIGFDSENDGFMQHVAYVAQSRIGYDAYVNGARLDLTGPRVTRRHGGPTSPLGDEFDIAIMIGHVDGRRAGAYKDTIVIDVVPLK